MLLRPAVFFGVSALLAAGPSLAQGARHGTPHTARRPAKTRAAPHVSGVPRTLTQALAATYLYQPSLQAERAKLRATDEGVPQALAGWRPTVVVAGGVGYGDGMSRQYTPAFGQWFNTRTERDIATAQATVTQPIYNGGKTAASVHQAKDQVMAERANLIAQEESSFTDTVNAYVGVIEAQQLLNLNINNEQVLREQLRATEDQFRVGEVTRTDVAQAEAALAGAVAQRETAEGNLQTARATYRRVIGFEAPADLQEPQPLELPVRAERQAAGLAAANNPSVISARFNEAAAKNAVDVAFAQLMPQLSLQGQVFQANNSAARSDQINGYSALLNLSIPLYQGGAEYAAVRQARQTVQQETQLVSNARRTAVQSAVQAWQTLASAQAAAISTRSAVRANEIALVGVEREHLVGTRTTLDVLNAQQALLNSRVTLVQNLSNIVTASYAVASAIGRLTARDLALPVPFYDDTAYYKEVKDRWAGLGNGTGTQPGH